MTLNLSNAPIEWLAYLTETWAIELSSVDITEPNLLSRGIPSSNFAEIATLYPGDLTQNRGLPHRYEMVGHATASRCRSHGTCISSDSLVRLTMVLRFVRFWSPPKATITTDYPCPL